MVIKEQQTGLSGKPTVVCGPANPESEELEFYATLSSHLVLPQKFVERVQKQVERVLPRMKPGASYTLKMLCGGEFWDRLQRWEQIRAGQCMAFLVVHRKLPLTFANPTAGNSKRYRLK